MLEQKERYSWRSSKYRPSYVCVRLVSRSHFADPKMADPANVWDLPIIFFLPLEV